MTLVPHGVITASVTPFAADGSVDTAALATHLDFLMDAGCDGVLVAATSGEFNALSPDELSTVYATSAARMGTRGTLYAGIIELSSQRGLSAAVSAAAAGADALLVAPPFFVKPTLEGIKTYFDMLAAESGLPIVLYNNPGRVGWTMDVEILDTLLANPNIVGIKDCERDLARISEKIEAFGSRLAVLSGDDDLGFPSLICGATGGIWAGPNLMPDLYVDMYNAANNGEIVLGKKLHHIIVSLCNAWFTINHPGPLKAALGLLDRPVGSARPPLGPITDEVRQSLQAALDHARDQAAASAL